MSLIWNGDFELPVYYSQFELGSLRQQAILQNNTIFCIRTLTKNPARNRAGCQIVSLKCCCVVKNVTRR